MSSADPPPAKRKRYQRYGSYWTMRGGKLYAVVNLPVGHGRYKKKLKRVSNKTEARQWAIEMLGRHLDGDDVLRARDLSFEDYAGWYAEKFLVPPVYQNGRCISGLRTYRQQQRLLDRLTLAFGRYRLARITVDVLLAYRSRRLEAVSLTTVNREFALLRTMFKRAVRRKIVKENPFDFAEEGLISLSLEARRVSPLTRRLVRRLLARSRKSAQPLLHYLLLMMLYTGARPSELHPYGSHDPAVPVEPVSWRSFLDFDFRAVRLVSFKGKIRREKIVPVAVPLELAMRRLYAASGPEPGDLIFPVSSFKTSWATLCRSVGVSGVRIRDFRHYYNTRLSQNPNINDAERMLLLGHEKLSTNVRYTSVDDEFIRKYREVIDLTGSVQ